MVDPVISSSQYASGNTTNLANSTLTTDFNVVPYYDDYDPNKQFYRILFKPGYAVQARELTQIQSMIQSQISRFGRHVFKEGSIVLPGGFTLKVNVGDRKADPMDYVKLKDVDTSNNNIDVKSFVGQTVVGATSNIAAYVVDVAESDGTAANTATLYVRYLSASSANSQQRVFIAGETLTDATEQTCIVKNDDPVANTGYASWFQIEEGVYFAKEHFIHFPTQSIILDRYNPNPSCKVGFYVSEEIINAAADATLLDPALESSNYAAPGADRFKLLSTLAVLPYEDTTGAPDFVTLFSIKDGVLQLVNDKADYNILGDTLAGRTFDESGDYVVRGLNVQISEHDRITTPVDNRGLYANGNNSLFAVCVDPGYAYVHGYVVDLRDRLILNVPKPTNFGNVSTQISTTTMGQYLRVTEAVGSWELDKGARLNFYDKVQKRITASGNTIAQKWSTGAQTGNNIGSGIVHSIQYVTGTPGYDAVYDIYLSDITMKGTNAVSNIRSVYYNNSPHSSVGADVLGANDTTSNTSLSAITQSPLLYYVGSSFTKTVRDTNGNPQTVYYYSKTDGISSSLSILSTGVVTIAPSLPSNDLLPYGNTTLSATDVSQDLILTMNESFNIGPLFGAATVSASGTTITGSANSKFTYFNVGDKITIAGLANTFYITAIANDTSMIVSNTVPASTTSNVIFKAYKAGDIINLNGKGITGNARTVAATPTTLTIDLKESLGTDRSITFTYKVASTSSAEKIKTLKPNRYVKINCATAGTSGPFCLGFSDVYQIRNIIKKTGSAPTALDDGTNVTQYFTLDNGQRDTLYDLARIFKSSSLTLGATDYLLVELDYFEPTTSGKAGFYTIDSYPIEDNDANSSNSTIRTENLPIYVSSTNRATYDLRNYIDFRPVKTITATDTTTIASATVNPSNTSTTYTFAATGMKFAIPSTEITYDYSYYLGRKDILTIDKQGSFAITLGVPDTNPVVPSSLETQMLLAIIDVAPYPSLSPAYGNALKRKDLASSAKKVSNRRYTMRDIGVLDERIKNLEYYTSLSLLEKDALNLKVLDDAGNDRFKNGIFIDTFRDTSLTAAGIDPDYRIVNDPIELTIRPLFSTESVDYDVISTSGVAVKNGVAVLAYSEAEYLKQTDVTDSRNLERGSYFFKGTLELTPNQDVWVDTSYAPDESVSINSSNSLLDIDTNNPGDTSAASINKSQTNTTWENWQTTVTGYNLYRGEGAAKQLVGTYKTEAEAKTAAAAWTTTQNGGSATIETLLLDSRKGTNYFTSSSTDTAIGANKLISSQVIPYIRAQTILVIGRNLKPYSKMSAFFDGINVSQYCTPLTVDQYNKLIAKQPVNNLPVQGSDLIVGNDGLIYFSFRVPQGTFRTGDRRLTILDGEQISIDRLSDEQDASTLASGNFFADGTKQVLQKTVYSTKSFQTSSDSTYQQNKNSTLAVLPNTWTPPPPPPQPWRPPEPPDDWTGHCCFDPNAKVLMANYTYKAISEIQIGDRVIGADGFVNTVKQVKTITVGNRKMVKFRDTDFYATNDHLFLTEKGWKTWDPQKLINQQAVNAVYLEGENKVRSINNDDQLKVVEILNNNVVENFVNYADLGAEIVDFDPDFIVYDLTLDGNATYIVEGFIVHNCCVAYTVFVKVPNDEEGMFCTGFDFYIQRKSQTRGMWFEIREMNNAGNITNVQIPGSVKRYKNNQIIVSPDGKSNPMQVRFDSPIFLFNNTDYAFVLHSDSPPGSTIDPDTAIWISRLGEKDRNTGKPYSDRQRKGKFYSTTNNRKWDLIEDVDIPFTVYRANFTSTSGTITLGNKPVEKLILKNVSSSFAGRIGDYYSTGDTLTLSTTNGTNTISVSDRFYGNVSTGNANGTIVYIDGSSYALSNTSYQLGEQIDVYDANGSYKGISANVVAIANGTAKLTYFDNSVTNTYSEFIESTGGFKANAVIRSVGNAGYNYRGQVDYVGDYKYSAISFEPKVLDFIKTGLNYEMRGVANGTTSLGAYINIYPSETTYFEEEKVLFGKSNEILNLAGAPSNQVRVTLQSSSSYVSPVFDMDASHSIYINNLINEDVTGETNPSGGKAINKYISQTIILADGQDAEDLKVYLSAYRPPNTDVLVYAKLLNASDSETFAQKNWLLLEKSGDGDTNYSSLSNRANFKEYTYKIPSANLTGPMGEYQYTSGGTKLTGYKYFAIKIVLTASNSAIVPRVADLRAIALQM